MARQSPLERARVAARLGLPPAPNARFRLLRRVIVRLNWFTMRHQMDYNLATLRAIENLRADLDAHRQFILAHQQRVGEIMASMEASLRSEILGSDRREDRLERDVIALFATTSALASRLDELVSTVLTNVAEATDDEGSDSPGTDARSTVAHLRHAQADRHQ